MARWALVSMRGWETRWLEGFKVLPDLRTFQEGFLRGVSVARSLRGERLG
jgi:hypothetical protein